MLKFILKFSFLVLIFAEILITLSTPISYSVVVQTIEQTLSNFEETTNALKDFETIRNGLVRIVESEIPKLEKLFKEYHRSLLKDEYLGYTLRNFLRFSDPLRILWAHVNETRVLSSTFLHKVSTAVTSLTRSYREKWGKETDGLTSPLVDEYTQEMKSLLSKFISHQFPIPSSSTDSTGKQSLKSLEKSCQGLTAEVAEHETSKQVLERVKRTAITQSPGANPCTRSDTAGPISPRSKVRHWTEEINLDIPGTLVYAILSCYQLQATDAILHYLNSLFPDDSGSELQELQERETDLALTAVWVRNKFTNRTIHHRKLERDDSWRIIQNQRAVPERGIWMCDPEEFELGLNVLRFSGVLQTCIYEEYALSPYESCSGKCKHYTGPYEGDPDYVSTHLSCRGSECEKKLEKSQRDPLQCMRLEGEVRICGSRKNDERYDWFSVGSRHNGKPVENETCGREIEILKEEWRLEHGILSKIPQLCEICQCQCNHAESGMKQTAYFSISDVVSDIEQNMIVTGLRFETKLGIIYTSVETGKLGESGSIDLSSLQWITPPLMSKEKTFEEDSILRLGTDFDTIYLDDVEAPFREKKWERDVLTGIRFRRHKGHISLEAQFTPIDLETKSLRPQDSVWLNRLDNHRKREILNFRDDDEPTRAGGESTAHSKFNQAIQFTSASIEKTAGQVIVPYFDSQPVHPSPQRSLIHGVGILFKQSREGHAGFIAFQINVS